jgi:hypothetical protein
MKPLLGIVASQISGHLAPPLPPVAGFSLWLDGTDPAQFTFSSSNVVSAWNDKSGNSNNFTQATVAYQPTRTAGLVTFDGSNDYLTAGSKFMNNMSNGGSNTLFMVFKPSSTNGGFMFDTGANSSSDIGFGFYNFSSTDFGGFVSRAVPGTSAVTSRNNTRQANNTTGLATIRLDANDATAANRHYFYSNTGAAQQTNAATSAPSASASSHNPVLGSNAPTGGDYYNGAFGEILWYPSDLSTVDREAVRDFLIAKWSI